MRENKSLAATLPPYESGRLWVKSGLLHSLRLFGFESGGNMVRHNHDCWLDYVKRADSPSLR